MLIIFVSIHNRICMYYLYIVRFLIFLILYFVSAELVDVSMPVLLCWFLLAEYFFYGTGHQATFPTIHWHAAFVGTGGHFYGNLVSAILIGGY